MKKQLLIATLAIGSMFFMDSCNKYEEGPGVSLRSRKERLANNWYVSKAYDGDDDVTDSFDNFDVTFTKDGATTLEATYTVFGADFQFSTSGTWSFEDNDEKLKVDYENDDADNTYVILKLEEDELWLREEGSDLTLHLLPN